MQTIHQSFYLNKASAMENHLTINNNNNYCSPRNNKRNSLLLPFNFKIVQFDYFNMN